MAQAIFKYTLPAGNGTSLIQMPEGAKILSAHNQHNTPCIWALIDTLNPITSRTIRVAHTGELRDGARTPLESIAVFVGTILLFDDDYVLHIFDLGES